MKLFVSLIFIASTFTVLTAAAPTGVGADYVPVYDDNKGRPGDKYGGSPKGGYGAQPEDKHGYHPGERYGVHPGGDHGGYPGGKYSAYPRDEYGGQPKGGYVSKPGGGYIGKPGEGDVGHPGDKYNDHPEVKSGQNHGGYERGKYSGQPHGGYVSRPGGEYGVVPGGHYSAPRDLAGQRVDYPYHEPHHEPHHGRPEHYDKGQHGKYPQGKATKDDHPKPSNDHSNNDYYPRADYIKQGVDNHRGDYHNHHNTYVKGYYPRDGPVYYPVYSEGYDGYNSGHPGSEYSNGPSRKYDAQPGGKHGGLPGGYHPQGVEYGHNNRDNNQYGHEEYGSH